jgi:hypothetical protein
MQKCVLWALCLLLYGWLPAQQFGGHPPGTRWMQVNTDSVRVIFPEGWRIQASEVAGMAQRIGRQTNATLGRDFRKISIVLQPKTTQSNGYVGLGPWRSEFYLTPPQNSFDLGSLAWHRNLALHEFRHVEQYNTFRKGVSRAFYYLFGQQGLELVNSAAVPNWFWEGDAVFQETLLSEQGRGRLPSFFNGYRSLWSAKKQYSWMKLRNGSLRDYVPDHYRLGYMMVAYGREKYGEDIWGKVTDDAVRYKGLFYPFQKAVKKYTGQDYKTFRRAAFTYFNTSLQDTTAAAVDNWAAQYKHFVADESYPQWIDDRFFLYVTSSYKKVPAFYMRDVQDSSSERLRIKDISLDDYFSYRNGKIVYAGYEPDIRWRWKDYSVIKWMDVYSRQHRTLTHHSHYFAPDISENGEQIVAVEVIPGTPSALHLLNSKDGSVIKKIPNPDKLFYTFPKFYGDGQVITAVRNAKGDMSLALVNATSGATEYLLPFSMNIIGFPTVHKDTISFSASLKGQDRLFVLVNKKLYFFQPPVTTATTGHYQLQVAHGRFAWTAFTAVGDHIEAGTVSKDQLQPMSADEFAALPSVYDVLSLEPGKAVLQEGLPADTLLPVTKYPKAYNLFDFHSWRPIIDDPNYTYSIIGENILNTLESEVFVNYNRDNKYKQLGASFTYGALYPWIRLSSTFTMDRLGSYGKTGKQFYFNTWENSAGLLLPLNLTSGRYNRSLTIGTDLVYSKRYLPGSVKDSVDGRDVGYLRPYLSFSNQLLTARRHIYPHFAQTVQVSYSQVVTDLDAKQLQATANFYFPGILPDHNIIINTAYHGRDTLSSSRVYGTSFPFSRGYPPQNAWRMAKLGLNYHFALLYPDFGVANIVYFTRVRTNLFYDLTRLTDFGATQSGGRVKFSVDLRSYGTEVFFDTKWWNQHNVTFGFRYSRLQDANQFRVPPPVNKWEFIVPVNLLGR